MRKLLYIALATLLATPFFASAITGEQVRFDWSLGQPAITDDTTDTCNNQAVARFDWSLGIPAIVFDTTATCTAAAEAVSGGPDLLIRNGKVIIQSGKVIVQ